MQDNAEANLFIDSSCFFLPEVNAQTRGIPPNVVINLADDLGYAGLGFNSCNDIPTPNIDKIAETGVGFTNDPEMGFQLSEETLADVLGWSD